MKLNQNLAIVAVLLTGLIGGGLYYWWWIGTPEYTLSQIRKAAETRNVELGMKYIDVDAIFENFWRKQQVETVEKLRSQSNAEAFGTFLGIQFMESVKSATKESVRQQWIDIFSTTTVRTPENTIGTIFQKGLIAIRQGNAAYVFLSNGLKVTLKRKEGNRYWIISSLEPTDLQKPPSISNEQSKINEQQSADKFFIPQVKPSTNNSTQRAKPAVESKTIEQKTKTTSPLQPAAPTRFEGIASIYITGGVWDNWDADVEKDGPVIAIVYRDRDDESILDDAAYKVPVTADVKVYAGESVGSSKTKLVFSSHYTDKQMVRCAFSDRCMRIPREEINVNTATDFQYGDVEVTVHTPEQGDFSARNEFIVLYLKK